MLKEPPGSVAGIPPERPEVDGRPSRRRSGEGSTGTNARGNSSKYDTGPEELKQVDHLFSSTRQQDAHHERKPTAAKPQYARVGWVKNHPNPLAEALRAARPASLPEHRDERTCPGDRFLTRTVPARSAGDLP